MDIEDKFMLFNLKNKISTSRTKSQQFRLIGLTGIVVVLLCNVLGPLFFHLQNLFVLQLDWWAVWFPNYIVWFSLLLAGFLIRDKENNLDITM